MQEITTTDLLLTREFWILGVASGILANVLVMLFWRSRRIVILGIQVGKARRKTYLEARDRFADSMASRENVDILSFLVLNFLANSAFATLALAGAALFVGLALGSDGLVLLILAPISLVFLLWTLMFTVSSFQKYYLVAYAMFRVVSEILEPKEGQSR